MKRIDAAEIKAMQRLYRINLMNGITGYKSANLIGTKSEAGIENVAVFSSVTHFGSNPALIGFVLRPHTVPRNTYENILETGYYTINHINKGIIEEAHHSSAKYDASVSEFEQTGLMPEYLDDFMAPFVAESSIKLAMKFEQAIPVELNATILVLGSVEAVYLPEILIEEDGFLDLNAAQTVAIGGLDSYHLPNQLQRLPYARPKK